MRASANFGEIIKERKVLVSVVAVLLLALIGGTIFYFMNGSNGVSGEAALPPAGSGTATLPGAARPVPGVPVVAKTGAPGAPIGAAGGPGGPDGAPVAPVAASGHPVKVAEVKPLVVPNSFVGAPPGYGGAPITPGQIPIPGGPGIPPTGPATTPTATSATKPMPIAINRPDKLARMDPFIPFYKIIVEQAPAYSFLVAQRLAVRPTPTPLPPIVNPDLRFGPLPVVPRRVAGVLFDGSVSAILETGTPGSAQTDVRVIQPGATVPSGVPYIPDLTVATISPTAVVLRADDGRTTTVKLSNVSAEFADAFHTAASGPTSSGTSSNPAPPGGGLGRPGPRGTVNTGVVAQ